MGLADAWKDLMRAVERTVFDVTHVTVTIASGAQPLMHTNITLDGDITTWVAAPKPGLGTLHHCAVTASMAYNRERLSGVARVAKAVLL